MSIIISDTAIKFTGVEPEINSINLDGEVINFDTEFDYISELTSVNVSLTGGSDLELLNQDTVTANIQPDLNTVNTANPGQYVLTYNYTDSDGDSADSKQLTVTVVDVTAPVLTVSGSQTTNIILGQTVPTFTASALDNTTGDITNDIVVTGSVDNSTVGNYTYTYNVSDIYGNAATTVTRTINVIDTTAPEISLEPIQLFYNVSKGDSFTLPVATFTDNYDSTRTLTPSSNDVDTSAAGVYTVTYSATDDAGNSAASKTITVNVFDASVIAESVFTVDTPHVVAYSGTDNIINIKLLTENTLLDRVDGFLDFSKNNIKRIDIVSDDGMISSTSDFVNIENETLKVKFGKLPGAGRNEIKIIAVLLNDYEIMLAAPNLSANIVLDLHE